MFCFSLNLFRTDWINRIILPSKSLVCTAGTDTEQSCDLSAGWSNTAVQLQVTLKDTAEFGGGVSLDQPGSGQQAWKERLKVQQKLIHHQATRPSHRPVQSCQRVGRSPRELPCRPGRLLLLQALCGLSASKTRRKVDVI